MAVTTAQIRISEQEFQARREKLLEYIRAGKYGGAVLFDS